MLVELTRAEASRAERHYAFEQVGLNTPRGQIVRQLVENGLDPATRKELVAEADVVRIDVLQDKASRKVLYGLLSFAAGAGLSIFSYDNSTRSGSGSSTVFWGLLLVGGVQGLSGFIDTIRYSAQRGQTEARSFTDKVVFRTLLVCVAGGAVCGVAAGKTAGGMLFALIVYLPLGVLVSLPAGLAVAGLLSLLRGRA